MESGGDPNIKMADGASASATCSGLTFQHAYALAFLCYIHPTSAVLAGFRRREDFAARSIASVFCNTVLY